MTSCRLPKPDWELISRSIEVVNGKATTRNTFFEFWHIPLVFLPFVQRNLDETGRESGFLLPEGENSSVKGAGDRRRRLLGHQSQHRYHGWRAILEQARLCAQRRFPLSRTGPGCLHRALECPAGSRHRGDPVWRNHANTGQPGGADILAYGRKYFNSETSGRGGRRVPVQLHLSPGI